MSRVILTRSKMVLMYKNSSNSFYMPTFHNPVQLIQVVSRIITDHLGSKDNRDETEWVHFFV